MNQWLDFNTNPTTFNTKLKPGSHDGKIIKEFGGREIAHQYRDQYSEANGVSSSVHTSQQVKVTRQPPIDGTRAHPRLPRRLTVAPARPKARRGRGAKSPPCGGPRATKPHEQLQKGSRQKRRLQSGRHFWGAA